MEFLRDLLASVDSLGNFSTNSGCKVFSEQILNYLGFAGERLKDVTAEALQRVAFDLLWSQLDLKHKPDRGGKVHYQDSGFRTEDS